MPWNGNKMQFQTIITFETGTNIEEHTLTDGKPNRCKMHTKNGTEKIKSEAYQGMARDMFWSLS